MLFSSKTIHIATRKTGIVLIVGAWMTLPVSGQDGENISVAEKRDASAAKFMTSCAGCHSLDGKQRTGPALNVVAAGWPDPQLAAAIKKMEPKAGPLPDDVVAGLVAFMKSPDSRERLKAEESRMAAQFASKMDPGDAATGKALFLGAQSFKNGGLSCAACHEVGRSGGNLGPSLDGIFEKTGGELPLVSSIEQAKFKIMEPHYARHPVTKQEAIHLAKYFATLKAGLPSDSTPIFAKFGAGAGVALLAGMFGLLQFQRKARGRDKRLQRRRK
jgi:cytochrome c2